MVSWTEEILADFWHWTTLVYVLGNMCIFAIPFALDHYGFTEGWTSIAIFGIAILGMEMNKKWILSYK